MKNTLKRLLSMALVLCMVVSLFPVSAFAENKTLVKGDAPEDTNTDNVVWVAGEPYLNCGKDEHTCTDACYELDCGHENGHSLDKCYGVKWAVCPGDGHEHTQTTKGDVVGEGSAMYEAWYGIFSATLNSLSDAAYGDKNTEGTVYYNAYWEAYNSSSWAGSWAADKAGKAAAAIAVTAAKTSDATAAANNATYCATYDTSAPTCGHPDTGHNAIGAENSCYAKTTSVLGFVGHPEEHSHKDPDCYSVDWTTYDDVNNNGIIDGNAEDPFFTITYADGVDGTVFAPVYKYQVVGAATPAFDGAANRDGYQFMGWNSGVAETVSGDATYTAVWHPVVSFNSNGGSAVASQTIVPGNTATEPAEPSYEWHDFDGWFKGEEMFDFATEITAPLTLTAKWTERGVSKITVADTEVNIKYEDHSNYEWAAQWQEKLFDEFTDDNAIESIVVDGEAKSYEEVKDYLSFHTVDDYGNIAEEAMTTLPGAGSEAGATIKVAVRLAEKADSWQAAESKSVTVNLIKAPGQNAIVLGSLYGASLKVEVNGNAAEFSNGTIGLAKSDGNTGDQVVITVSAYNDESNGYFFLTDDSISVTGSGVSIEIAEGRKSATIEFTADSYEGDTFTINVAASAQAESQISVNASYEVKAIDLGNISFTKADMVSFFQPSVPQDSEAEIQVSGYESINALGEYTINFSYAGTDAIKASSASATLIVSDGRPETQINLNENVEIGYVGEAITEDVILRAVVDSVSTMDGSKITNATLTLKESLGSKIWKEVALVGYIHGMGSSIGGDSLTDELLGDIPGNYKVTVNFAGDNKHKAAASVDAYFTVTDSRPSSKVEVSNVTKEHTDISTISYDLAAVEAAFDTKAVYAATGAEISNADVVITSIRKGTLDYIYSGTLNVNNLPITEPGEYTVVFQCNENNFWKKSSAEATFTILDARAEGSLMLKQNQQLKQDNKVFSYTQDELLDMLFEGIDTGAEEYYIPVEVSYEIYKDSRAEGAAEPAWTLLTGDITEYGSYMLSVSFDGDNTHKAIAETSTSFSITDNRPQPSFSLNSSVVPFNFEKFSKDDLIEALGISCDIEGLVYNNIRVLSDGKEIAEEDYAPGFYTVEISFFETVDYNANLQMFDIEIIDDRSETSLSVQDASLTYKGEAYSSEEIAELMIVSLTDEEGEAVDYELSSETSEEAGKLIIKFNNEPLNAGEYEVSFNYTGDTQNKPAEGSAKLTIEKAPASVTVTETKLHYINDGVDTMGYNAKNMISLDPANADAISFVAGLYMGDNISEDAGTVAIVDLPQLVSDELMQNPLVQSALSALTNGGEMSISDLRAALEAVLSAAELVGKLGINISTESIESLISALQTVEGLEGVGNLTIRLTMNQPMNITDSGMYLVGSVITDENYQTAFGMNYLIVSPDGMKAELAWNVEDANGFFTIENIRNGNHDMGAHVASLAEGDIAEANAQVETLFLGIDKDGNTTMIKNAAELEIGVYTQIAYIADLGNTMYYAEPIVREVLVVTEAVQLKFIDENGNENPHREYVWEEGVAREMTAVVYGQDGVTKLDESEQAKITYTYMGIESDGEVYMSSTGPIKPGAYTVIASYQDTEELSEVSKLGMAVGALVIKPQPASISVNDLIRTYEPGKSDSLLAQISKDPADAQMAVMVAGISNVGDFSEEGLAAVEGVVYIDLPDRVESALRKLRDSEYFTVDSFKAMAAPLLAAFEAAGIETADITAFYNEIAALPGELSVEFFDSSSYSFEDMGSYVVIASIMDCDYYPAIDTGLVVIHPETHNYTLAWNYKDANGIITRPVLESEDLLAHALDADSVKDDEVTAKLRYIVTGFSDDGEAINLTGDNSDADFVAAMKALPNGIYNQIAYVKAEIDADINLAAPIMRQIILTPQDITITVPNSRFNYGSEQLSAYPSYITASHRDGTPLSDEEMKNLTIKYIGVDVIDGGVYQDALPENSGAYAVYAEYKSFDENGKLEHFGIGLGTLTIVPARLNYDIQDSIVRYDGNAHEPSISNPKDASDILFIVDTKKASVNVVAPSLGQDMDPEHNWDGDIHIQHWLEQLNQLLAELGTDKATVLAKLESMLAELEELTDLVIIESDSYQDLMAALTDIDSDVLTINAGMPVEAGVYNVYGIAYKDPNHVLEISEGVLKIIKGYPIYFTNANDAGILAPGMTVIIDGESYVLDEELTVWAEEDNKHRRMALLYDYTDYGSANPFEYADHCENMYVWDLQRNDDDSYTANRVTELDNVLKFAGTSIWLSNDGVNGLRAYYNYTGTAEAFAKLGYEVVVHGTVLDWAANLGEFGEAVPRNTGDGSAANYAAGHAEGGSTYTDTIYPASEKYVSNPIRMRFYVELRDIEPDENGNTENIILYSGSVQRSIGYVAWQNRDIYNGQVYDTYVERIIEQAKDHLIEQGIIEG